MPPLTRQGLPQACVVAAWLYYFVFLFRDRVAFGIKHKKRNMLENWKARPLLNRLLPACAYLSLKRPVSVPVCICICLCVGSRDHGKTRSIRSMSSCNDAALSRPHTPPSPSWLSFQIPHCNSQIKFSSAPLPADGGPMAPSMPFIPFHRQWRWKGMKGILGATTRYSSLPFPAFHFLLCNFGFSFSVIIFGYLFSALSN